MTIVACLKWVAHPGEPTDERFAGMSPADQSALEFALQQAAAIGQEVLALTVGPAGADSMLRDAIACGAARAVRIDAPRQLASADVAAAIAAAVRATTNDVGWVWCGDYSLDRGSASVPAFLAAHLRARQALGVVAAQPSPAGDVRAVRRLDGGRREVLHMVAPAIISVEGATATLRRAPLGQVRTALSAAIEVLPSPNGHPTEAVVQPYRPRARAIPLPAGDTPLERLRALTDARSAAAAAARGERLTLAPPEAAARIVSALEDWGYLPPLAT